MTAQDFYQASPIKHDNDNSPRRRATGAEMEERALFLIAYAYRNAPVTVRQLFYAATVAGVPGISKDDNGYNKVQQQVLELRRSGRMPYWCIADLTRFWRGVSTYSGVDEALHATAKLYRKALWRDKDHSVEFWLEKDALAGCVQPVADKYAIPLMVTRGFSSETFAYEAAQNFDAGGKPVYVYHLGDFDRSGQDAADDLERKLKGYAQRVPVIFQKLAVQPEDIEQHNLPTRSPKRNTPADKKWPYDFACELDAMPPALLRSYVESICRVHLPDEELSVLIAAEESERMLLHGLAGMAAA
ncbi:hypothetical protein [Agrobacterium tumefaciens]|uniref:DUF2399 domain-containing protein n=1 Tax=Agrobacterium tumefaciens TaxID=358 RepID=A0A4D7YT77_AGRTU|nr:hypothetical protein [Agrobacterium tumefaciens]QCL92903.1 hypothetical protein CFBP7129_00860 [Agrobacterium tumefaciens]UXS38354.1 hypothetical protein FY150_00980 [Agrobacterium tumefaciens]